MRSNNSSSSSSSSSSSGVKKTTGDFIGNSDQEYSVHAGQLDMLEDIQKGVEIILGCSDENIPKVDTLSHEEVTDDIMMPPINQKLLIEESSSRCERGANSEILRSSSSIIVKATPAQMETIRHFIDQKNELLTQQISIQISFINIELTDEKQLNVDFDLIAESISCLLYTSPSPRD